MVNLTDIQKQKIIEIYPKIKTGRADSVETTKKMVILYNDIFKTGYKPGTSCSSCLNEIWNSILTLYKNIK